MARPFFPRVILLSKRRNHRSRSNIPRRTREENTAYSNSAIRTVSLANTIERTFFTRSSQMKKAKSFLSPKKIIFTRYCPYGTMGLRDAGLGIVRRPKKIWIYSSHRRLMAADGGRFTG